MAELLKRNLKIEFSNELKVEKFIGQSSKLDDKGFPQHLQIEILQKFRENEVDILVATSVAEEGLDIPNVDAIIFYEPVPSEIRLIQRRGRTGRNAPGRCYILLAENTVDIPFYHVARRKENSMNSVLTNTKQLKVLDTLDRKKIDFNLKSNHSELDLIKNFRERKEMEEILLANRTIEDILTKLDKFSNSEQYKNFKNCGVTFYSDLKEIDENILRAKILKKKQKKMKVNRRNKPYLNKNVKSLIKIVRTYCQNGKLDYKEFQKLAMDEDIVDRKFHIHFNRACSLGYLKKQDECVHFVMDFN